MNESTPSKTDTTSSLHESLLASVLALERFQIDLRGVSGRDEMFNLAVKHLGQLLPIEVAGFFLPNPVGEFTLQTQLDDDAAGRLNTLIDEAIDSGVFGWALKHPRPAPLKTSDGKGTLILGALRTRQQVLGMFAAVVNSDYLARWNTFAPIVATYLSRMADTMLSDELTRELQEHNRRLDVLVRQRTEELEETAAELAESQKIISCAANVTQLLLAPPDFDSALHRSVVVLGQTTRADRVCFLQSPNHKIAEIADNIEWLSGEAEADSNPDVLPEIWGAALRDGHTLLIHSGSCPPAGQAWLNHRSVQSLLAIPISTGDLYWGYLRFDACTARREWSSSELSTLSTISSNIGLAFRRHVQARQLEAAKETAEVANRAKDRFLATVSHELRTPLNAVLGYTQSLIQNHSLPSVESEQIAIIHNSAEHLLVLINDLLDLAKADLSRIELTPTIVSLRPLATNAVKLVQGRAEDKGLNLGCLIESGVPESLEVDGKRLRQVLINLLGNAIKFTQQGSVKLEVSARGEKIRFRVSDTGCGISAEEMPNLFRPFSQLGSESQKQEGSGLGLAISKNIVQAMGTDLHVESELGKGSSFWFEVPIGNVGVPSAPTDATELEFSSGNAWKFASLDRLQRLHALVASGDILELQAELTRWIEESPEPNPVAQKLLELAGAFRIKAIRQILQASDPSATTKDNNHV